MRLVQKITAYDKVTERLAFDFDLPENGIGALDEINRHRLQGALPLNQDLIEKIAPQLQISHLAIDHYDWFLEPFASEEALSAQS